jgi:hypothetical protein
MQTVDETKGLDEKLGESPIHKENCQKQTPAWKSQQSKNSKCRKQLVAVTVVCHVAGCHHC